MTSKPLPIAPAGIRPARYLEAHGLRNINAAYWNLGASQLIERLGWVPTVNPLAKV